jgi:hypothetical protein
MTIERTDLSKLNRVVARLQAGVLAVVCAIFGGLGLFIITVWLLLKGGQEIGPHLKLLSQYLIGYSVTWTGSLVGALYGILIGGISGWMIATIYNAIVGIRGRKD